MLFRLGLCSLPPFPLLLPAKTGSEDEYFPNYVDVALQAGLTARTVIAGHESKDFLLSTTGGGIALFDYDNDGWLDIFVVNGSGLARFPKVTPQSRRLQLEDHWNSGAAFLDYDRDGHLDLFVSNYVADESGLALYDSDPSLVGVQSPVLHGPAGLQGSKNILYHNNGDGTFADVSKATGIANSDAAYGFTPCVADYDNDGWPDIYVANDSTPSLLFKNNRNGTFT